MKNHKINPLLFACLILTFIFCAGSTRVNAGKSSEIKEIISARPFYYKNIEFLLSPYPQETVSINLPLCINQMLKYYGKDSISSNKRIELNNIISEITDRGLVLYELKDPQPKFLYCLLIKDYPLLCISRLKKLVRAPVTSSDAQRINALFSSLFFDVITGTENKILNPKTVTIQTGEPDYEEIDFSFLSGFGNIFPSKALLKNFWSKPSGFKRDFDYKPFREIKNVFLMLPENESLKTLLKRIEQEYYQDMDNSYVFPEIQPVK
ncbi:MAG: hypothetical protein ABIA63_10430 [bacterium]